MTCLASLEIGSPQAVVNLRVEVLEERVAEKRTFSSLLWALPHIDVGGELEN
jgi:hypothetical protein